MKNRKKTNVEENKASMSKKIGKYAVIVVIYIALVSTLAFIISTISLLVNADSINDTPDYQYLKTSYYNWDNITWYTDDNTFVTGSNDTFSSLETWNDYYQISQVVDVPDTPSIPTDLTNYVVILPSGFNADIFTSFDISGTFTTNNISNSFFIFSVGVSPSDAYDATNIYVRGGSGWSTLSNLYDITFVITGGSSVTNQNLIQWFVDNNATFTLDYNSGGSGNSLDDEISLYAEETEYYTINRFIVYNSSLSTNDLNIYDSVLNTDLIFNSIVFEKNNFFMKVGDLNNLNVPMISASVLSGGYDISFEINGFVRDVNGDVRDLSIVTDERIDVLGYQTLYPTFNELFGNVESINNDTMMYINNIRVLVEFPNNYVDNLSYRYSVSSIESNNIKYGGALTNWVNSSIGINMGDILLDNVNAFLQFELLPNFTLFNLFVLIVAIPLLIWILKLILGG